MSSMTSLCRHLTDDIIAAISAPAVYHIGLRALEEKPLKGALCIHGRAI